MTTNPRGRDLRQQAGRVTPRATVRATPVVTTGDKKLDTALAAIKDILDRHAGGANLFERWQTGRDLEERGLTGGPQEPTVPPDAGGVPIWTTGRARFRLVSMAALADAVAAVSQSASSAQVDDTETRLRRQIQDITPGMSSAAVQNMLVAQAASLLEQWRRDDATILAALTSRIDANRDVADRALHLGLSTGFLYTQASTALVWTIPHNLGRLPSVTVLNASDEQILPDVEWGDLNTVVITHGRATAGKAILR